MTLSEVLAQKLGLRGEVCTVMKHLGLQPTLLLIPGLKLTMRKSSHKDLRAYNDATRPIEANQCH